MNKSRKLQKDIAELLRLNERNMIIPDPELAPEAVWMQELLQDSLDWRKDRLVEAHTRQNGEKKTS